MATSTVPFALVVEEDPLIIMDTTFILEEAGFRVREAYDGDEAIAVLKEHWESTTLLFSDVDMPGETNGFALARHVDHHWPDIEIVIASGHVMPKGDDMPAKATFVRKPFNARMVHEHLNEMLPDDKKPEPLKKAVYAQAAWLMRNLGSYRGFPVLVLWLGKPVTIHGDSRSQEHHRAKTGLGRLTLKQHKSPRPTDTLTTGRPAVRGSGFAPPDAA